MHLNEAEAEILLSLAAGRLLRLLSRPYQPGDEARYQDARAAALIAAEALRLPSTCGYVTDYARDRNKGAAGDS